jgi:ubiquitin-conjugating enzyme E2 J2
LTHYMSRNAALTRLTKELRVCHTDPLPGIMGVRPNGDNSYEIHFVIMGADGTHYAGGQYWGKLVMPPTYPTAPPDLIFFTPSGRFIPGKKICTSFTAYHPESWSPLWTINTLLAGVISFMAESASTAGSIDTCSYIERRQMAAKSWEFNANASLFATLFPELCDPTKGLALMKEVLHEKDELNRQMVMATGVAALCVLLFVILRTMGLA